ncbi:MAG TPA: hypothetical protein VIF14_09580 [Alphaproteobacteria bacterium]|jgi:hypothetical protein
MLRGFAIAALVIGTTLFAWQTLPAMAPAAGIPVERLREEAARGAVRYLTAPLPEWLPLPASGRVSVAGDYAPQPPYGAAISITLVIDEPALDFAAAYSAMLGAAGYRVRRVVPPFDFTFASDAALDAYDPKSGRYVVCVLRHSRAARFAQITFWEAPAPRL